ncbi:MAG: hypothetical protein IJO06_07745 [Thermoguttaceae bacterium]|nr:hypothetical protein [Thermoguttaceae bacterium]
MPGLRTDGSGEIAAGLAQPTETGKSPPDWRDRRKRGNRRRIGATDGNGEIAAGLARPTEAGKSPPDWRDRRKRGNRR